MTDAEFLRANLKIGMGIENNAERIRILRIADILDEIVKLAAQVGRSAKRQDNEDWLGPKGEHAVHEVDAPDQSHISISNPTETGE